MSLFYPSLITLIAVLSAAAGVWLTSFHGLSRRLVPFGGGVLLGVALFWVLPEMADYFTWQGAILWLAGGFLLLAAIDRFVYPVCPACSPSHQHDHCATRLHGFALPLLAAAALHSAWTDGARQPAKTPDSAWPSSEPSACTRFPKDWPWESSHGRRSARGFRLGLVRAGADGDHRRRGFESVLAPHLSAQGLHALLALAGGSFLYLGGHAVHGELRRSGTLTLVPALTGVAGSSVLRLFLR